MDSQVTVSDLELVDEIREFKCSDSLVALTGRHVGILNKVFKRYSGALVSIGYSYDSFKGDFNLVTFKACTSFRIEGGSKFSTWLCNHARYHCLNQINKKNKIKDLSIEDEQYLEFLAQSQSLPNSFKLEIDYVFKILSDMKDKRISKVFNMRYFGEIGKNGCPWSKIGEELGISTQTAINLHEKGAKLIRNKLKSPNPTDKI